MNKKPKQSLPPQAAPCQIEVCRPTAHPIYWAKGDGSIWGPARPEFLAREGMDPKASYWIVVQFEDRPVWINSTVLRSKQAFERQGKPMIVTLHKEYR